MNEQRLYPNPAKLQRVAAILSPGHPWHDHSPQPSLSAAEPSAATLPQRDADDAAVAAWLEMQPEPEQRTESPLWRWNEACRRLQHPHGPGNASELAELSMGAIVPRWNTATTSRQALPTPPAPGAASSTKHARVASSQVEEIAQRFRVVGSAHIPRLFATTGIAARMCRFPVTAQQRRGGRVEVALTFDEGSGVSSSHLHTHHRGTRRSLSALIQRLLNTFARSDRIRQTAHSLDE
jgi:hypothetical protein